MRVGGVSELHGRDGMRLKFHSVSRSIEPYDALLLFFLIYNKHQFETWIELFDQLLD